MHNFIKRLLVLIGILTVVACAVFAFMRFLTATEHISGTDADTRDSVRYEPMKRHYTKLILPTE